LRVAIGGVLLATGLYLYIYIMARLAWGKAKEPVTVEPPVAEALHDPQQTQAWLDSWRPWVIGAIALVVLAYTPVLLDLITNMVPVDAPLMKLW